MCDFILKSFVDKIILNENLSLHGSKNQKIFILNKSLKTVYILIFNYLTEKSTSQERPPLKNLQKMFF